MGQCCSDSRNERHSSSQRSRPVRSRPVELEPLTRDVMTLQQLEYDVQPLGMRENPFLPGSGQQIQFYIIRHPDQPGDNGIIAILAAWTEIGLLVVNHLYTVYDPRPQGERPLAADILLSFWYYQLGMPIEELRTIFLENVLEESMKEARLHVYGLRRKALSERLMIRRGGDQHGENDAFNLTYHTTKFGRCARTMETQNLVMRELGIKVSHFEFDPRPGDASAYNVVIEFAVDQGHHGPHGGHRGHH